MYNFRLDSKNRAIVQCHLKQKFLVMSQKFLKSYALYHPINPEKDLKAYGLWKSLWNSGISRVLVVTLILSRNMILSNGSAWQTQANAIKIFNLNE